MTQQGQITPGNGYIVQAGDTLSSIAQRAYNNGSRSYWIAIYWMNQIMIGNDPDVLRPGIGLSIPLFAASPQAKQFYIVQAGDILSSIAQRAYNNSSHPYWTVIYLVNQNEIGNDPNALNPGKTLFIPRIVSPPQPGGDIFYIVQTGDTLSSIAQQAYNDGSQWTAIYNDNIGVIGKDPNLIVPGQILYIRVDSELGGGGGGNIHFPENPTWGLK